MPGKWDLELASFDLTGTRTQNVLGNLVARNSKLPFVFKSGSPFLFHEQYVENTHD